VDEVTANRIRDFSAYIAVGLCLALVCLWFAERDIDVKWLSLAIETCLVFGCTIGWLKRLWRRPSFWISLGVLFIVHLIAFGLVLQHVREWRASIVGVTFAVETGAVTALCELLGRAFRTRGRRGKRDSVTYTSQKK
jgi:ribose/xylose/arabinose/galactoside ABC-type transport system permease subunit